MANSALDGNSAFRLLLGGSFVSMMGSRLTTIAFPMLVLYLTKSPLYAGFAVFATTAPTILVYIPAGALVDRWDPRRTMLRSEAGRGIAIAIIVVLLMLRWRNVPLIIGLVIVEEILEIFSTLAERRYVQVLVKPQDASSALVRIEARTHVVVLVGRPLGSMLFQLAPVLPFFTDVATFFISIFTLFGTRYNRPVRVARAPSSQLTREVRSGLGWLLRDHAARNAILLLACLTLITQALIMVFICYAHAQRLSTAIIGIVLAMSGLGGALGTTIHPRLKLRLKFQLYAWSAALIVLFLPGQFGQIPRTVAVMATLGFIGSIGNVQLDTYLIHKVPDGMLARVTSVNRLISFAAFAIGPALGGVLIGTGGYQVAVYILFAITLALAIISIRVLAMPELPMPEQKTLAQSTPPLPDGLLGDVAAGCNDEDLASADSRGEVPTSGSWKVGAADRGEHHGRTSGGQDEGLTTGTGFKVHEDPVDGEHPGGERDDSEQRQESHYNRPSSLVSVPTSA